MTQPEVALRKVPEAHRFELFLGDERVGLATYRDRDGTRAIPHTEISPAHEGQGLGSQMVRAVLDATRAEGLSVVPECPFVQAFIDHHPDYADLVA